MENITINYVRCWHNCENLSLLFFSQRLGNLCLYWRCWKYRQLQQDLGGKMLSNHLLFAVVLRGRLPFLLWCTVQCTEMLTVWCLVADYLLFDLLLLWKGLRTSNLLHSIHQVMLVLRCENSVIKCLHLLVITKIFRIRGREFCQKTPGGNLFFG